MSIINCCSMDIGTAHEVTPWKMDRISNALKYKQNEDPMVTMIAEDARTNVLKFFTLKIVHYLSQ